jgi:hypothetical protein
MAHSRHDPLPDGLRDIAELLQEQRVEATPLELDRIKAQAMRRASRRASGNWVPRKGLGMRARVLTPLVAALLFGGTVAGGIAGGGGGKGDNAGEGQYGCDGHGGKGGYGGYGGKRDRCDDDDHGGPGKPHKHHKHWRKGGRNYEQWSDDGGRSWRDWNGRGDDW